jgi:hypothetical protein
MSRNRKETYFLNDVVVDLAGSNIIVSGRGNIDESLVITKIQINYI